MAFAYEALGVDDDEPESGFVLDGVALVELVLEELEESELPVVDVLEDADEPEVLEEPRASFL